LNNSHGVRIKLRANAYGPYVEPINNLSKLLNRKGLQFFYVYVTVFRERNHHRGDALAVLLVCSAYAKLFAG
jgi:hypothetical protein